MADRGTMDELRKIRFFNDVPDKYFEILADMCRPVEFRANATVFEEYGKAKEVYLIVSGQVSLAICEADTKCRQIDTVADGDMMGWSPLVGRPRLSDTAFCITPVRAYAFDGEELLNFCRTNPEFGFPFMHHAASTLAHRLSGTRMQLMNACGFDLPQVQVDTD